MSEPTVLQGASYTRVSTLGQMLDDDGRWREDSSPEVQFERCLVHARSISTREKTYKIEYKLSDHGLSGKDANRPAYQQLISLVKTRKIKFVMASELARLSRSTQDFLWFIELCHQNNVEVIIIGLNLNTVTPHGRLVTTVLIAMAEYERRLTSMRVRENALSRLLSDGKINGSAPVLGLDKDSKRKGHYVINEEERDRLNKILNLFLNHSSKKALLRDLEK